MAVLDQKLRDAAAELDRELEKVRQRGTALAVTASEKLEGLDAAFSFCEHLVRVVLPGCEGNGAIRGLAARFEEQRAALYHLGAMSRGGRGRA